MLKLRIKVERVDHKYSFETLAIANTGFVGIEPEILIPQTLLKELKLYEITEPEIITKTTGNGREVQLMKCRNCVYVCVIAEDRISNPILCSVIISQHSKYVLLNDKLLSKLGIVIIDAGEGIWCFRDELGKIERRSY